MYNLFLQDSDSASSKFLPLPQLVCLLACSLGKSILEILQAEEDLIFKFPWAGTLTAVTLTKKSPHSNAIPITSSIITEACFGELGPCRTLQAAECHPWALGVLWEQAVGWALRE